MSRAWKALVALLLLLGLAAAAVVWLNVRDEAPMLPDSPGAVADAQTIERGEYLARAGNCAACHTARGGEPYAGGRAIETPFGIVFASNLTPDLQTGIGRWTSAEFWRAMHNGRSRDGRLLYPVFPYPDYTRIKREDADALLAYLRSLPAVAQANRPHGLRAPYDSQAALALWRALYFKPERHADDPQRTALWNRGAYLVRGLGHCAACHAARNRFGATLAPIELRGGLIPMQSWYAPSLGAAHEAGVAEWPDEEIVQLLAAGVAPRGSVQGPMAEVVFRSTQYLDEEDLLAMATYLKALPSSHKDRSEPPAPPLLAIAQASALRVQGEELYKDHCAACHGERGEGVGGGVYPALAGNRAVTLHTPANLVRIVLTGGFLPATAGNPRPYGMPAYSHVLDNAQIAAVLTYIRSAWGNQAAPTSTLQVLQLREGQAN